MMTDDEANLQRQMEAANKLMTLACSSALEGRLDLTYVYAEELISAAATIRQCALHQLVPAAKRAEEAKDQAEREENEIASMLEKIVQHRARNTSALDHSAYPSEVEVFSMDLSWDHPLIPGALTGMSCAMEKRDQSAVQPAVGFFDLPEFFASHTGAGISLKNINIYFFSRESEPPGDEHFRLLLELAGEKCRPTIFSAMKYAFVGGWLDFGNVTATTFKELFGEVLTARTYQFTNLYRLPVGVEPADLLLYPTLMASQMMIFSVLPGYGPNPQVVKFPTASILAHLKGKSKGAWVSRDVPAPQASYSLPQLLLHELYLADGEMSGVEVLVEAIKQDFFEDATGEKRDPTEEKREDDQRLYPFSLFISYSRATAFDLRHCGEWHNSLGERLHVCPTDCNKMKMLVQMHTEYHIEVRRISG